jgi:hypothetical protein
MNAYSSFIENFHCFKKEMKNRLNNIKLFSVCDSSNIVAQPRGYGNVALPNKSSSITSHLARQRPRFKIHQFKP